MILKKVTSVLLKKITIVLTNLQHLPTSASFHQDTILHIQVAHQWQVRSMHSLIRVWFLNPFGFPTVNAEHITSRSININAVSMWIVFCKYCSHRIESPYHSIRSISISSPCHFYFVLYCFIDFSCPCICPYQSS